MPNSQQNLRFTNKAPRRTRRGALMPAALLAVLVLTILMSQFAQAQLRRASAARSEARAVQLAAIAADFDFYVHTNRDDLKNFLREKFPTGSSNTVWRPIAQGHKEQFIACLSRLEPCLRIGVVRHIPGFDLDYMISQGTDGEEVFGALRFKALNDDTRPERDRIIARLARHAAPDKEWGRHHGPWHLHAGRLIRTAPFSGVNPAYVLREHRTGHTAPKFTGAGKLDLGGHNLTVKNITAMGGDNSATTQVVGSLHVVTSQPPVAETTTSPPTTPPPPVRVSTVSGNVEITGTTRAETFTVGGTLTSSAVGSPTEKAPLELRGPMTLSGHMNIDTLSAASLRTDTLISTDVQVKDTANLDHLTTETLQSPAVTVSGTFTAQQVFSKNAQFDDLNVPPERCHGC